MMAVMRNASSATQFCGSAIVSVPDGGRKKKLNTSMADTDAVVASTIPQAVARIRMTDDIRERNRRRIDLDQLGVQRREEGDETSGRHDTARGNDATHDE